MAPSAARRTADSRERGARGCETNIRRPFCLAARRERRVLCDGRPLFGWSKSIRGLLVSVVATSVCARRIGLGATIGFVVAVTAIAGDLLSSFIKQPGDRPRSVSGIAASAARRRQVLELTAADIIIGVAIFLSAKLPCLACCSGFASAIGRIRVGQRKHLRRCKVISGGQLIRTGTMQEPTPTDV